MKRGKLGFRNRIEPLNISPKGLRRFRQLAASAKRHFSDPSKELRLQQHDAMLRISEIVAGNPAMTSMRNRSDANMIVADMRDGM